ncbi:MAG: hypothetical protein V2A79_19295 [Planctomycetota bacterium]
MTGTGVTDVAQAATEAKPQAGTVEAQAAIIPAQAAQTQQAQAASADGDHPTLTAEDIEALQRELKEARTEAAKYRKAQVDAQKAAQTAVDAQKPDAERQLAKLAALESEKANWERERQEHYVEQAVARLSGKHTVVDLDAAVRLMDWSELQFGDDGRPTNTEDVLKALLKERPYLAGPPRPPAASNVDASAGTGAGPTPALTADELAAAKDAEMTPEHYAALKGVHTLDAWQATRPQQK